MRDRTGGAALQHHLVGGGEDVAIRLRQLRGPEVALAQPGGDGVAEQGGRVLRDEGEAVQLGIGDPHDRIQPAQEVEKERLPITAECLRESF